MKVLIMKWLPLLALLSLFVSSAELFGMKTPRRSNRFTTQQVNNANKRTKNEIQRDPSFQFFKNMPPEITQEVLLYLGLNTLKNFLVTCKKFYEIGNDAHFIRSYSQSSHLHLRIIASFMPSPAAFEVFKETIAKEPRLQDAEDDPFIISLDSHYLNWYASHPNMLYCPDVSPHNYTNDKLCIISGSNVNRATEHGFTALSYVVWNKQKKQAKELIKIYKADCNASCTAFDITLAGLAIVRDCPEILTLLKENGADLKHLNKDGFSLLHLAIISSSVECTNLLCRWEPGLINTGTVTPLALVNHILECPPLPPQPPLAKYPSPPDLPPSPLYTQVNNAGVISEHLSRILHYLAKIEHTEESSLAKIHSIKQLLESMQT